MSFSRASCAHFSIRASRVSHPPAPAPAPVAAPRLPLLLRVSARLRSSECYTETPHSSQLLCCPPRACCTLTAPTNVSAHLCVSSSAAAPTDTMACSGMVLERETRALPSRGCCHTFSKASALVYFLFKSHYIDDPWHQAIPPPFPTPPLYHPGHEPQDHPASCCIRGLLKTRDFAKALTECRIL